MFEETKAPRLFGLHPGADFTRLLYLGLKARTEGLSPEALARIEIFVNTRRMERALTAQFLSDGPTLVPRIRLVTDLGQSEVAADIPPPVAPLRRKLEVARLVSALIKADSTLAAEDSAFDLADSLVTLMGEMRGEGVTPETIASLDVSDQSGHWARAQEFIGLINRYFQADAQPDAEARQRLVIEALTQLWQTDAPKHPVLVVGSTGSRGATALLMQAVSRLPQGAVVLPGVDWALPEDVWASLDAEKGGEDHPQFRFKALCDRLSVDPKSIIPWVDTAEENPARSALVSLSLRPAPVTDQWLTDGPKLQDLKSATQGLTLLEAPTPRLEADAIAVRLRTALEDGQTAALITPDRMLTRQVTAALDRWNITPDDSAGLPLQLSPPGRILRHTADLMTQRLDAELLLILLRHPLANSSFKERGPHILKTNALDLSLRRFGPAFPDRDSLTEWARRHDKVTGDAVEWVDWISTIIEEGFVSGERPLADLVKTHLKLTERLCAGPNLKEGSGELWQEAAGREAYRVMGELSSHADAGGDMSAREYRRLVSSLLAGGEVRDRDKGHPNILIWGTLEARVQTADLVILGGLNEGSWPEVPSPDPWLNRALRMQAGLLLPERRIGLSAHDYQQGVCAKDVVISRSIRTDEAETVPSRWVNRLTNLLGGLEEIGGTDCLAEMRKRGDVWINLANRIAEPETQIPSAKRPSPRPPADARPKDLSVTQIKTLIRDPYAIYARKILKLNSLDPLAPSASASLRGMIVHDILEAFVKENHDPSDPDSRDTLMLIADRVLAKDCPWPAVRVIWRSRIEGFADHFLEGEIKRRAIGTPVDTEMMGETKLDTVDFSLKAKADRIDLTPENCAIIYDYKTGAVPSGKEQKAFDKQLLLEAAMVERGAFKSIGPVRTESAVYIGLGSTLKDVEAPLKDAPTDETWPRFEAFIRKWMDPSEGYTSRRANQTLRFDGDYDHLARYGEWDETFEAVPEDLS